MTNLNITNFRKKLFESLKDCIKYDEPLNVSTKEGNVVVITEQEYNNIMETLSIYGNPQLKKKIIDGINTPIEECLSEDEVKW